MSEAENFSTLLNNLAIDNGDVISARYGEITSALNKKFRSSESKTDNTLQVGSYGRRTAIKGASDLDMLYLMPLKSWSTYESGGQYRLLRDAADAIEARYPKTTIKVDRLVVRVLYTNFHIEVQPVFEQNDGGFLFPDSYNDGSWRVTKPREELATTSNVDGAKNGNLRRLCKMARAWRNRHGVGMGGLLIDTLAHNFLTRTTAYDKTSFASCGDMATAFFEFLADEPKQKRYAALGSGQHVKVTARFQGKAKKALAIARKAASAEKESSRNAKWRKVFGKAFPVDTDQLQKSAIADTASSSNAEEFFEDRFAYDVRHQLRLVCDVTQDGFRPFRLHDVLRGRLRLSRQRSLRFFITDHNIAGPFTVFWKVLNRGPEAIKRNMLRGQIFRDKGKRENNETSDFFGDHFVECVAVQNGVVVATDRIHVPIEQ